MRQITKGTETQQLRDFKRHNRATPQNLHYDHLGGVERVPMLAALIAEQHGLCAYTMKRLTVDGAHIEHILPRSAHPTQTLNWQNLLACFPAGGRCDFGAIKKRSYDPGTSPFVNPLSPVNHHFRFLIDGTVEGRTPEGQTTISDRVLHLNHRELVNDRKAMIDGALKHRPTAQAALRRAQDLRQPDQHGLLAPYCEALARVLEQYAANRAARSARLRNSGSP